MKADSFRSIPPGRKQLLITLAAAAGMAVSAIGGDVVKTNLFALTLEQLMALEIAAVTATRVATPVVELPADVTTLSRARFAPYTRNIIDALAPVPGIKLNSRQDDHLFLSGMEIRGFTANDTSGNNALILLDGIPQHRLSFGGAYAGGLPFDAVSNLELVKGPLGSLYGRGALAGALQLFTDPGTRDWRMSGGGLFEGTTETYRGALNVSGPVPGTASGTFSLFANQKTEGGWQPRTDSEKQDVYLHVRQPVTDDDTVSITVGAMDGSENVVSPVLIDKSGHRLPGIARDANLAVPGQNSLDLEESRLSASWAHAFDDTLQSTLAIAYWRGDTYWRTGRPDDGPAKGTVVNRPVSNRDWNEDSFLGQGELQKRTEWTEWLTAVFTAGGSAERLTWENTTQRIRGPNNSFAEGMPLDLGSSSAPTPAPSTWVYEAPTSRNTDETDYGAFLRAEFDLMKRVVLHGGIRYDTYERSQKNLTSGQESTVSDNAVSPMAGLLWRTFRSGDDQVNTYVNWGRGFSPVFRGVTSTEILELNPETSESIEAGVKTVAWSQRLEATLAAYRIERQDLVALDPTTRVYRNSGMWCVKGIEAGITLRPLREVELYGNYTYRQPDDSEDQANPAFAGNDIAFVPRTLAKAGIGWSPVESVRTDFAGRYVGASYADMANTIRLPAYVVLDASVSYRWRNLRISVFGRNLLDKEYFADEFQGVVNGAAFEGTPRTFGVAVEASL
ncbi:MAG: TonB-dependent receptor [bacterium]